MHRQCPFQVFFSLGLLSGDYLGLHPPAGNTSRIHWNGLEMTATSWAVSEDPAPQPAAPEALGGLALHQMEVTSCSSTVSTRLLVRVWRLTPSQASCWFDLLKNASSSSARGSFPSPFLCGCYVQRQPSLSVFHAFTAVSRGSRKRKNDHDGVNFKLWILVISVLRKSGCCSA